MNGVIVAFIRLPDGEFHTFSVANSPTTQAVDINDSGDVTGVYYDTSGSPQGFVVQAGGTTPFSIPGALQTEPAGINASGVIAGFYIDSVTSHGFIRDALGNITTFDPRVID